jgi:carbon monoxide dehydrogenase subunit G
MHLEGNYTFAAPPEQIWSMLHDTAVLAAIIPGCEKITQTAENSFQLDLRMKAGPVEGPLQATITLSKLFELRKVTKFVLMLRGSRDLSTAVAPSASNPIPT